VAGVLQANELLRHAQLSRAALRQPFTQHLQAANFSPLLPLTAPVHARMLASPRTVAATLDASRIPARMLSGSFRRVARPLGPVARRAAKLAGVVAAGPRPPVPAPAPAPAPPRCCSGSTPIRSGSHRRRHRRAA